MPAKIWDRFDILRAVYNHGTNLTQLALEVGLDGSACRHALDRPQLGGELAIARLIAVDPAELWPDRYRQPLSKVRSNALEAFRASQKKRLHANRSVSA
ncbi:helix-turn-helix domain-containing protein [Aurantimonas sp. C2-3-R2]|uniref:helix-turn-helix domain-containing protein n=1 Tax=unclassified Aurantimonas TaxID=2638230 RepID=UPI003FA405A7